MNRIQLVGQLNLNKQLITLADGSVADLLLDPTSEELKDVEHMQYVLVSGDMLAHPTMRRCLVRASSICIFPGDKNGWSSGVLTLCNPQWLHTSSFNQPSTVVGSTNYNETVEVKMPLTHSRWNKKTGMPIKAFGSVDLEVTITGSSHLSCVSILADRTYTDKTGAKQALPDCDALTAYNDLQKIEPGTRYKRRTITPKLRRQVFERDAWTCKECGARPHRERQVWIEVDHIIPVARGGTNELSNLRTLCDQCNKGKGVNSPVLHT